MKNEEEEEEEEEEANMKWMSIVELILKNYLKIDCIKI